MAKEKCRELILEACREFDVTDKKQIAYIIATAEWETNHTCDPVREAYWLTESWRKDNLEYYPYYGRGYVQLTWRENYKKIGDLLQLDLLSNPDLVLDPNISSRIIVYGMKHGLFTGKKLNDYISGADDLAEEYENARRIINGTDKQKEIASIAINIRIT